MESFNTGFGGKVAVADPQNLEYENGDDDVFVPRTEFSSNMIYARTDYSYIRFHIRVDATFSSRFWIGCLLRILWIVNKREII